MNGWAWGFPWIYMMLTFVIGCRVGGWAEARLWRGKAQCVTRKESGGKLYRVTEEP